MNKSASFLYPDWPAPENIGAAMTLRVGGVSAPPFASLNLATHVGDDSVAVANNRSFIRQALDLPSEPVWLEQIHSNRVVEAINTPVLQQADAAFTGQAGVVCAVLTADCLPLLICSKDGEQVAAVHAGWKGLLAGVVTNTLTALKAARVKSAAESGYLVWLGPAIGPKSFEVGAEVREAFIHKNARNSTAFLQTTADKWLADIYQLARIELADINIVDVYGGGACTFAEAELYYSYRREMQTGRMASLIWRKS